MSGAARAGAELLQVLQEAVGCEYVGAADENLPRLPVPRHLVADSELRVGGAAHHERHDPGDVLLRHILALVLVPVPVPVAV